MTFCPDADIPKVFGIGTGDSINKSKIQYTVNG